MTLTEKIRKQISKWPRGKTFGYSDLDITKKKYVTAAKILERLQKQGVIKKISKGVFYKPQRTIFGELQPDYMEQLRPYLFEDGKRIAYETGTSLYNRMGLTTQVPFRIKIASRDKRISINRGGLKASSVKSYTEVTEDNYQLLQLLDAFKDIKNIPDCSIQKAVKILSGKLESSSSKQITTLTKYALLYPPRVRALVGAVLENLNKSGVLGVLKESLNPLTNFKLGLKEDGLSTVKNWNIH